MRRNVGIRLHGVQQAVCRMTVLRMEVAVLAPAWTGRRFRAEFIEQRAIDQRDH